MQKAKVKYVSTVIMIGLAIFLIYYPYRVFNEIVPFALTNPELWETHWMVEKGVMIPTSIRLAYLVLWLVPVLATMAMTAIAMHFFHLLRQGVYFDPKTVRDVQLMGLCAVVAGAGITLAYSVVNWLLTFMNVADKHGIHFGYDPSEISLILTGIGLFIGGWVLKVVALQDQEIKDFV
ncbi:hypothetical protein F9L33_07715 [Amylibacter sp. SFDW26]|uniref:hypothetical protein n=1 Tax=Amylibacter sp. SFDW26 TaxID=2652722 RepID=UPI001261498D|nr:hypothetical protein [Amylibacter sp. SFDW26]KAB7614519.1 hypothetical protein F9L33_07715 [Amylibacter sp. SFDW26]